MVIYSINNELAYTLESKQMLANMAPVIVTVRHPYLFTKILAMGPINMQTKTHRLIKDFFFYKLGF